MGITLCEPNRGSRTFSQTNDAVANAVCDLIVDLVPSNQDLLIDAYCGAGFFAKALLDKFETRDRDRLGQIRDWAEAKQKATPKETYVAGDVDRSAAAGSAAYPKGLSVALGTRHYHDC